MAAAVTHWRKLAGGRPAERTRRALRDACARRCRRRERCDPARETLRSAARPGARITAGSRHRHVCTRSPREGGRQVRSRCRRRGARTDRQRSARRKRQRCTRRRHTSAGISRGDALASSDCRNAGARSSDTRRHVASSADSRPRSWGAWHSSRPSGFALLRGKTPGSPPSALRSVVAVGAINDYASPDSSGVGRALRDMLATNLARAPEITVISGSRLLEVERQMNRGAPSAPGAIVPVARQAGATTLIDGALYPLGIDTLRLDLRVTNLHNGNVLRAYTVTGRDPFALADSATARLVEYLGAAAPRGSVADAMTRSVTAYRLYEEGLRSFYLGDIDASGRLFDAALADDSTFAMAAYYSARATRTSRSQYLTRLRRAVALAAHASDRERLIIEGGWAEANNSPRLMAIGRDACRALSDRGGRTLLPRPRARECRLVRAGGGSAPSRRADGLPEPSRRRCSVRRLRRAAATDGQLRAGGLDAGGRARGATVDRRTSQGVARVHRAGSHPRRRRSDGRGSGGLPHRRDTRRRGGTLGADLDTVGSDRPVREGGRAASR